MAGPAGKPGLKKPMLRIVRVFEDGSKLRSDGKVFDPDTKKWVAPPKLQPMMADAFTPVDAPSLPRKPGVIGRGRTKGPSSRRSRKPGNPWWLPSPSPRQSS
jgi:hypothetical protein